MQYLKRASLSATNNGQQLGAQVEEILQEITRDGEAAVKRYALKFDQWRGEFLLPSDKRECLIRQVSEQTKQDIQFAYEQVKAFAQAQRQSIQEFEISTVEGVKLGQKVVPVNTAGCYVPGGPVPALMSIATAKAAGVKTIIACSPPKDGSIHPAPVIGDYESTFPTRNGISPCTHKHIMTKSLTGTKVFGPHISLWPAHKSLTSTD